MKAQKPAKETFVTTQGRMLEVRTAAKLSASAEERIAWLHDTPRNIRYPLLRERVLPEIAKCVLRETKLRRRCRVVLGPANIGKSTVLHILEEMFPPQRGVGEIDIVPYIRVDAPRGPDAETLLQDMLCALWGLEQQRKRQAAGLEPDDDEPEPPFNGRPKMLERQFIRLARRLKLRAIGIDDIENMLRGGSRRAADLMIFIKRLSNVIPCAIICTGTHEAAPAIGCDTSTLTRFKVIPMPRWTDGADFRRLLAHLETYIPLRKASNLAADELAHLIMSKTGGLLGEVVELVIDAAEEAIENGVEQITAEQIKHFAGVAEESMAEAIALAA